MKGSFGKTEAPFRLLLHNEELLTVAMNDFPFSFPLPDHDVQRLRARILTTLCAADEGFCAIPVASIRRQTLAQMLDLYDSLFFSGFLGRAYGEIDFLILNGDIPNHSGDIANFDIIYQIAGEITEGRIPVVFARGNHDLRGVHAEDLADYTPSDEGRTYFTFRLSDVWGIVLDCGEDKLDSQVEYGGTICCHAFRLRETAFLRRVIANAKDEYEAPGVRLRLVVAHNPFSQVLEPPFDIEQDLYREWCQLIKESIHPQLMLCGHIHRRYISLPGSQYDQLGQPCPMIVCSEVKDGRFTFCGVRVDDCETAQVSFVNGDGSLADTASVPLAAPSR